MNLIESEHLHRARRQRWAIAWEKIQEAKRAEMDAASEDAQAALRLAEQNQAYLAQIKALEDEVSRKDNKILRMQGSVSWRMTSPLRAIRRAFEKRADSFPTSSKAAATAPEQQTRPDPRFLWSIDNPRRWEAAPATGHIRGWFFWTPGDQPPKAIRIRIDSVVKLATCGIEREDVVIAHRLNPLRALKCGFQLDYALPIGAKVEVELEAHTEDGRWIRFLQRELVTCEESEDQTEYRLWLTAHYGPGSGYQRDLRSRLSAVDSVSLPKISVLMPVYNAPAEWLEQAIHSVKAQLYGNWELCIADDASTQAHIRPLLEAAAHSDSRIKVCFREENGHISRASNSALELVTSPFVALFDHDDELRPEALAEVALYLAKNPDTALVYTDEDKIDTRGIRSEHYFKPDFLPELITGQNFCSHLSVFNTLVVRQLGGFRVGYEGSQDWDLVLRVARTCGPKRIGHIPRVLYSWRKIAGSTAVSVEEKSYALKAARNALLDYFSEQGIEVCLNLVEGCHWQVVLPLPSPKPLVSIIIPTHNKASLLRTCVASLLAHTDYDPFEIIVVNNRSDEMDALRLLDELRDEPGIRVIDHDKPFNYSEINNVAVQHARGEYVLLLNNDIEVIHSDWLREMVSHAVRPGVGAVGAMLHYPNNTIQHAGVVLGVGGVAVHSFWGRPSHSEGYVNRARLTQNYSAVTGACLLVKRSLYLEVGGLNEKDLTIAFNDVDFCLRLLAAGYRNVMTPFAELIHHESASRGLEDTPEKHARFKSEVEYMQRTWAHLIEHDPAYNPNLTLKSEGWALSWPPRF